MSAQLRYPGVRPFETRERPLFFGRARDVADLYDLVLLEKLLVLFGKSGYGKSSLLKAGIIPLFTEHAAERKVEYRPIEVRLGAYQEGRSASPLTTLLQTLANAAPTDPETRFLEAFFPEKKENLWLACKQRQSAQDLAGFKNGPSLSARTDRYLFIFDQFEEFFTYPEAQQQAFRVQLAEALYEAIPQRVRDGAETLTPDQRDFLARPFDLKVVFSIRADRLSLLDSMKAQLPAILHKRYELKALDEKQARSAIVRPAALSELPLADDASPGTDPIAFASPPFSFEPQALDTIVRRLAAGRAGGGIEAFQLQIVCQHIERQVQRGRVADRDGDGLPDVTAADLPDFETVYEDYYRDKLAELPPQEAQAARAVVEDGLLFVNEATGEARRLSKDPDELAQDFAACGATPELLRRLEATYLLRREANTLGGFNYEISHDTLIGPIVKARAERRRAEKEAVERERLRVEAEAREQQLREERRKHRQNRQIAIGAVCLSLFAFSALAYALLQQKALRKTTALVVAGMRQEAKGYIYQMEYDKAWDKLGEACQLREQKDSIGMALMEIAFFFGESGQWDKAKSAGVQAAGMMEVEDVQQQIKMIYGATAIENQKQLRDKLRLLQPDLFLALEKRYYPDMVPIKGGTFKFGKGEANTKEGIDATLSDYKVARTETTFWQWGLFCAATGQKVQDFSPGWGLDGDNPAVNMTWYQAAAYANWLSTQLGLTPAYTLTAQTGTGFELRFKAEMLPNTNGFRLPTETQWEYAARGGTPDDGTVYSGSNNLDEVGSYLGNGKVRTNPVQKLKPNALGLYDMSGNVWEWCWDWYGAYPPAPAENYAGSESGSYRVLRGGSWYSIIDYCSVRYRYTSTPWARTINYGFRLAQGK